MKYSPLVLACALFAVTACEDAGPPTGPASAAPPLFAVGSNTLTGDAQYGTDVVFPSTNAANNTNGWARVLFVDAAVGGVTLNFVSTRGFASCFEYRIDDEAPTSSSNGGNNWNPAITDGMWLYTCQNNSSLQKTFTAQGHVDIRMSFGAETDERFNWTRFYALPGYALTLHDEAGNPLAGQAGVFKYRCGGSWAPSVAFTTDANGKFSLEQPACANWDKKVTVTVNQTSREQDVTVNPVFQTAKVNANLKSCT
ncbi:MAG: hypothetical protein H6R40_640, partial [Gemmatimonadetes bacterium]|nr:hypothetical protein [Gemmatimonadota bacterium]